MDTRINLSKVAPEVYQAVVNLDREVSQLAAAAGISDGLSHLLRLRASQLNGCAYCIRIHTRDALKAGESNDRISLLSAWEETEYFDDKERAALALIEAVTLIAEGQVPEPIYEEAADLLSDEEIAAIEWLGVVINAWNRVAIVSRYPVKP